LTKSKVAISKSYRLINYGPTVLITSGDDKSYNVATIAWTTPISHDPVLVGISVYEGHFTSHLIKRSKEFVINVPPFSLLKKVIDCGSIHGGKVDKFKKFKLTPIKAKKVKSPLVEECFCHLECKVIKTVKIGDHSFFVGKVVYASADKNVFTKKSGIIDLNRVKSIHHLGGNNFGVLRLK
jgi:flavin reductase (DIM6/NTAB) family NADH-FMN oxidoreductase RutF